MAFSTHIRNYIAFQLILLFCTSGLFGQSGNLSSVNLEQAIFKANLDYEIQPEDEISVAVFQEANLSTSQIVDVDGYINLPLLETIRIAGLTIRQAEDYVKEQFIEQRFLRKPQVTVRVTAYAVKTFHILGEVRSPGIKTFPRDAKNLDIVEVISMAGDFTDVAAGNSIRITRRDQNGDEKILTIDAQRYINGKNTRNRDEMDKFLIFPDDIIFVPESFF